MAKGFGGVPGNMQAILKKAQKMQVDMQRAQETAEQFVAEGSSGGGTLKIQIDGKYEVKSVHVSPEILNPNDSELVADLITTAVNQALEKVRENAKVTMDRVAGASGLGGLF